MQYTLRGIPAEVDNALRLKARQQGKSLNEMAIEILTSAAGVEHRNHDFDFLIGTWRDDPELEKTFEQQRQIDPDLWK